MAFLIRLRNKAFLAGYKYLVKPVLFRFDPEDVHDFFVSSGNIIGKSPAARVLTSIYFNYKDKSLEQEILGLKFSKTIGLSGGFDKNVDLTQILQEVGFGFMDIGSITVEVSPGNLGVQRLKRLPKSNPLQVYYGLKNELIKYDLNPN